MSLKKDLRLLVVDPHTIVRAGIVAILRHATQLQYIHEASNAEDALYECRRLSPHIVITEIILPKMDGITFLKVLHNEHPDMHIIVLSSTVDEHLVHGAIQAGATSYLLKNVSAKTLIEAIEWACCGQSHLSPEATQALIHLTRVPQEIGYDLTHRENEVLSLMCDGLSNREISQTLNISNSTVQFHVSSILSKLGVTNRVEAVSIAFRHHLVS